MTHRRTARGLIVRVDRRERERLRRYLRLDGFERGGFDSDAHMKRLLNPWLKRWRLKWVEPHEIGALTSAPCLISAAGRVAWGFMSYQVTSVQRELADNGEALFERGQEWGTKP